MDRQEDFFYALKFSVKKPFTVVVAVVMIFILGAVSFMNMTTDLLPKIELPYVVVSTTYIGASPEKVESNVTKPMESALSTCPAWLPSPPSPVKTPVS